VPEVRGDIMGKDFETGVSGCALELETPLAPDPISARAARRFVGHTLEQWGCEGATEVALLLTTELVTNAIIHARTNLAVRIAANERRLRVAVSDTSHDPPRLRAGFPGLGERGRGLPLVDALSSSWGVDWTVDGKAVWFELAQDRAPMVVAAP
jgi:anti-sigma regulatory factor (Ser/Thr protein kinase)